MSINIAIDGPAGAGKTYLAKEIAKRLGYIYIDTGALYRAIALYVHEYGCDPSDPDQVIPLLNQIIVNLEYKNGQQKVIVNNNDVSDKIRAHEISKMASDISAIPEVRKFLLGLQKYTAMQNNSVMEGRDIGTVVLPDADVKFFVTADLSSRTDRRYKQLIAKGETNITREKIMADIAERDQNDSTRETAPLCIAEDAILYDTSNLSKKEAVSKLLEQIKTKLKEKGASL